MYTTYLVVSSCGCLMLSLLVCGSAFADRVALPKTGQTASYATGDDGANQKGVAWPVPRFSDKGDGTVKDNLTGLIWLKNANCSATLGGVTNPGSGLSWANALTWSNNLAGGSCGLTDGSTVGQWRLPSRNELSSLVDRSNSSPALPAGHPFTAAQSNNFYWSGSSYAGNSTYAWVVSMLDGNVIVYGYGKAHSFYVWPVRAGQ